MGTNNQLESQEESIQDSSKTNNDVQGSQTLAMKKSQGKEFSHVVEKDMLGWTF